MKALVYEGAVGLDKLTARDIPIPCPSDDEILVKVHACSLNVADYSRFRMKNGRVPLATRLTNYLMGYSGTPLGSAISGTVVKTGKSVGNFLAGDAVYGQTPGTGGLAEFAILRRGDCCLKPSTLSFEESSAIPMSFGVALGAVRKAGVAEGDCVLVYGASGGVGLFAVQIAKDLGCQVAGVCSTRNIAAAKSAGCDYIVDYQRKNFAEISERFDAILGVNGHNPMKVYKRLLSPNGIFVGIGDTRQGIDAMFASLYSKSFKFFIQPAMKQKDYLLYAKKMAEKGNLQPVIGEIYPVEGTGEAIGAILQKKVTGKIVLSTDFKKNFGDA